MRAYVRARPLFMRLSWSDRLVLIGRGSMFHKYRFMGKYGKCVYTKLYQGPWIPKYQHNILVNCCWPAQHKR